MTGLVPNTQYTFNLSGAISTAEQSSVKIYSRPATIRFSTDYDAPPYVDRPEQDRRNLIKPTSQLPASQVYLRLHRASTKNGPINRYYIVVHLLEHLSYQSYVPQEVRMRSELDELKGEVHFFLALGSTRMLLYSCCFQ